MEQELQDKELMVHQLQILVVLRAITLEVAEELEHQEIALTAVLVYHHPLQRQLLQELAEELADLNVDKVEVVVPAVAEMEEIILEHQEIQDLTIQDLEEDLVKVVVVLAVLV